MANTRDFPGSPVVKTFECGVDAGSIPGQGTKTPHALGPKHQNIRQKQYCNKFNKDFKSHPHKKKKILKKMANTRSQNMRELCTGVRRYTCQTSFWLLKPGSLGHKY